MRAVAPQIVSCSTSKKCSTWSSGRLPQRSERYVPGAIRSASGCQNTRSTSAACGVRSGGVATVATLGTM